MRVSEVIPITTVEHLLKIVGHGKDQKSFGPGVAVEFDVEYFPDGAPAAVGADQVIGSKFFGAVGAVGCDSNGACILPDGSNPRLESDIGVRVLAQSSDTHVGKLVLLGLD